MTAPSQEPRQPASQEVPDPIHYVPAAPQGAAQYPQAPYGVPENKQYQQNRWNGWAIAGFIVSFFASIIGIILSIVGLVQVRRRREKGQGLAIAGIVIGALRLIASIIVAFVLASSLSSGSLVISGGDIEFNPSPSSSALAPSQKSSPSTSAPSQQQQQYYDDDFYESYSNDLDAFDDDLVADLEDMPGRYTTLEEYMNQSGVKNQLDAMSARMPEGLKMQVSANGNTMTYDITLTKATGAQARTATRAIHAGFADDMHEQVYEWKRALKGNPNTTAKLVVKDAQGNELINKTYTTN